MKILFVCHGNICRSPMAEFVMKQMLEAAGLSDAAAVESAATSREELGNPVYPPVRRLLAEHNISCAGKYARQIRREDYAGFDMIIGMDKYNIRNLHNFFGADDGGKISMLLDHAGRPGEEVADPWYSGDFEATWNDVNAGCRGLMKTIFNCE